MRIWIYGRNEQDIRSMLSCHEESADVIVGFSIQKDTQSYFPQGGLTSLC